MQKSSVEFVNTGIALYNVLLSGHQVGICMVLVLVLVEVCPVCEVTVKVFFPVRWLMYTTAQRPAFILAGVQSPAFVLANIWSPASVLADVQSPAFVLADV